MTIAERVRQMLENPGFYILGDVRYPEALILVSSMGGKLHSWKRDEELAPDRFLPGMIVKHGPLT